MIESMRTLAVVGIAACVPAVAFAVGEPRIADAAEPPRYAIDCPAGATDAKDCVAVDEATYLGWKTYKIECQQCHGGGGLGSTFAPNLLDRINKQGVDFGRFLYVMEHGYKGQMGAMPSMAKNARVQKAKAEVYTYLKARADGVIPNGRPPKPAD